MILTREQIDNYWYSPDLTVADLRDTARAYHDLRDGVLAWCDEPDWSDDPAVSPIALDRLRAVVARLEGETGPDGETIGLPDPAHGDLDESVPVARVERGES